MTLKKKGASRCVAVCGVPLKACNQKYASEYFSVHGKVVKIFVQKRKRTLIVRYDSHEAAEKAKVGIKFIDDQKVEVFYCRLEEKEPSQQQVIDISVPDDVMDELRSHSSQDICSYEILPRPASLSNVPKRLPRPFAQSEDDVSSTEGLSPGVTSMYHVCKKGRSAHRRSLSRSISMKYTSIRRSQRSLVTCTEDENSFVGRHSKKDKERSLSKVHRTKAMHEVREKGISDESMDPVSPEHRHELKVESDKQTKETKYDEEKKDMKGDANKMRSKAEHKFTTGSKHSQDKEELLHHKKKADSKLLSRTDGKGQRENLLKDDTSVGAISVSSITSCGELAEICMKPAYTAKERYQVLEARDRLLKLKKDEQESKPHMKIEKKHSSSQKLYQDVSFEPPVSMIGTCPDMCPEKERYLREYQHQVAVYEAEKLKGKYFEINHHKAIKEYSRSSADKEEPFPYELRSPDVLLMTISYLLCNVVDLCEEPGQNLSDWYHFLWDRTRSIRKDVTQQQLCDQTTVTIVECCSRFHIFSTERLCDEGPTVLDQRINTENLTKCLETLKQLYDDLNKQGKECPNEAEFRAYYLILNLNRREVLWDWASWSKSIQKSVPVQLALAIFYSLNSNNYCKFFKLFQLTTYLNACLLKRYFNQIRVKAIKHMIKAFRQPGKPNQVVLYNVVNTLGFESSEECIKFLQHYGIQVIESSEVAMLIKPTSILTPTTPYIYGRSMRMIESKRTSSIKEVIAGGLTPPRLFVNYNPHSSFDSNSFLKEESWTARDQGHCAGEANAFIEEVEKELKKKKMEKERLDRGKSIPGKATKKMSRSSNMGEIGEKEVVQMKSKKDDKSSGSKEIDSCDREEVMAFELSDVSALPAGLTSTGPSSPEVPLRTSFFGASHSFTALGVQTPSPSFVSATGMDASLSTSIPPKRVPSSCTPEGVKSSFMSPPVATSGVQLPVTSVESAGETPPVMSPFHVSPKESLIIMPSETPSSVLSTSSVPPLVTSLAGKPPSVMSPSMSFHVTSPEVPSDVLSFGVPHTLPIRSPVVPPAVPPSAMPAVQPPQITFPELMLLGSRATSDNKTPNIPRAIVSTASASMEAFSFVKTISFPAASTTVFMSEAAIREACEQKEAELDVPCGATVEEEEELTSESESECTSSSKVSTESSQQAGEMMRFQEKESMRFVVTGKSIEEDEEADEDNDVNQYEDFVLGSDPYSLCKQQVFNSEPFSAVEYTLNEQSKQLCKSLTDAKFDSQVNEIYNCIEESVVTRICTHETKCELESIYVNEAYRSIMDETIEEECRDIASDVLRREGTATTGYTSSLHDPARSRLKKIVSHPSSETESYAKFLQSIIDEKRLGSNFHVGRNRLTQTEPYIHVMEEVYDILLRRTKELVELLPSDWVHESKLGRNSLKRCIRLTKENIWWKVIVSVADEVEEGKQRSEKLEDGVRSIFGSPSENPNDELIISEESYYFADAAIAVSMKFIRQEKDDCADKANCNTTLCGIDGLIFICDSFREKLECARYRLRKIVESKYRYPPIPVFILVHGVLFFDAVHVIETLELEELKNGGSISEYYMLSTTEDLLENSHDQMKLGLKWLAAKKPVISTIRCDPVKDIMNTFFSHDMWILYNHVSSAMHNEDPSLIIFLYNFLVDIVTQLCCFNGDVLESSHPAPEFYHLQPRISFSWCSEMGNGLPHYWRSSDYQNHLKVVILGAKLPEFQQWPLCDDDNILNELWSYCKQCVSGSSAHHLYQKISSIIKTAAYEGWSISAQKQSRVKLWSPWRDIIMECVHFKLSEIDVTDPFASSPKNMMACFDLIEMSSIFKKYFQQDALEMISVFNMETAQASAIVESDLGSINDEEFTSSSQKRFHEPDKYSDSSSPNKKIKADIDELFDAIQKERDKMDKSLQTTKKKAEENRTDMDELIQNLQHMASYRHLYNLKFSPLPTGFFDNEH